MDQVTPRINAALREKYVGRPVRIVGRVVDFQPPHATLEASGTLQVSVPAGTNIQQGHDFEVLGRVNPDLSLTTLSAIDFGTGFGIWIGRRVQS